MSGIWGLFMGKPKEPAAAAPVQIAPPDLSARQRDLTEQISNNEKAIAAQEKKANTALQAARAAKAKKTAAGDKDAMLAFKRYKLAQGQIAKYQGMRDRSEGLLLAMQSTAANVDHVNAMATGVAALKQAQKAVDVDRVAEVQDDYAEAMDDHAEVERVLADSWGSAAHADEDEMKAELDAMLDEEALTADLTTAAPAAAAPAAGVMAGAGAGAAAA